MCCALDASIADVVVGACCASDVSVLLSYQETLESYPVAVDCALIAGLDYLIHAPHS